jgi:Poly(ADP-ribose) polymerase catalytic domain
VEVQRNGNLLGKGIYFTDMIMKAIQYTGDANRQGGGSRFVLVCEVALGNTKEFMRPDNGFEFTEEINSVLGAGR